MKKILITNDDGISAEPLDILRRKLSYLGDVVIVAPNVQRNASGNAMTLHKPVRIKKLSENKYAVTGTPADCTRIGTLTIMEDKVDMVISGINCGANLGDDINYSGTAAAAREGAMLGIPSLASSLVLEKRENYELAADITVRIAKEMLDKGLPPRTFLNLNVPDLDDTEFKGIKVTSQGIRIYERNIRRREDPIGRGYYWILGSKIGGHRDEGTDMLAVSEGYASLTPITLDYTAAGLKDELLNWSLD